MTHEYEWWIHPVPYSEVVGQRRALLHGRSQASRGEVVCLGLAFLRDTNEQCSKPCRLMISWGIILPIMLGIIIIQYGNLYQPIRIKWNEQGVLNTAQISSIIFPLYTWKCKLLAVVSHFSSKISKFFTFFHLLWLHSATGLWQGLSHVGDHDLEMTPCAVGGERAFRQVGRGATFEAGLLDLNSTNFKLWGLTCNSRQGFFPQETKSVAGSRDFPPFLLHSWSSGRFGLTFCLWPLVTQPELATWKGCSNWQSAGAAEFHEIYRSALKISGSSREFKSGQNSNFVLTHSDPRVRDKPPRFSGNLEDWRRTPQPQWPQLIQRFVFSIVWKKRSNVCNLHGKREHAGWDSAVCLLEPHPEQLAIPASASWFLSTIENLISPKVQKQQVSREPLHADSARSAKPKAKFDSRSGPVPTKSLSG